MRRHETNRDGWPVTRAREAVEPRGAWWRELLLAIGALAAGAVVLPLLIYYIGAALLGRYENGSAAALFGSIYAGLREGSFASWTVVLGPFALLLLFRLLAAWWRATSRLPRTGST